MDKAGRYYHGKAGLTSLGMPEKLMTLKSAVWVDLNDFSKLLSGQECMPEVSGCECGTLLFSSRLGWQPQYNAVSVPLNVGVFTPTYDIVLLYYRCEK